MIRIEDYYKLIKKVAYDKTKNYDLQKDLISEGCLLFYKALERFDEKKGKFSAYFYRILYNNLQNSMKNLYFDYVPLNEENTINKGLDQNDIFYLKKAIISLDETSKKILKYVLENGFELQKRLWLYDIESEFKPVLKYAVYTKKMEKLKKWWENIAKYAKKCQNFGEILYNLL